MHFPTLFFATTQWNEAGTRYFSKILLPTEVVAVVDWYSWKVLSWRLSNSIDAGFCIEALKDALAKYGPPEIFNSDQGSQFTSTGFTDVLRDAKVKISMDGRGRWIDNRMIERFGRSPKPMIRHPRF